MAGDSDGRGGGGRGSTGSPGGDSSAGHGGSSSSGKGAAGGGGSSNSSSSGGFMSEVDTGGTRSGGSSSSTNSSSGQSTTQASSYGGRFGGELGTTPSSEASNNQSITSGTIASMDEAAEQAERSFMDRLGASPMTDAQAERSIQENASPGVLGSAISTVASLVGGVPGAMLSTGVNTALSAQEAARNIEHYNGMTGANLDSSFGHSLAQQSVGTATGFLGGKVGGTAGARAGASVAGLPGAIAGGLLGGMTGKNFGREAAFAGPNEGSAIGVGAGDAQPRGLLASAVNNSPVATAPSNGPTDFDGYASYAESFFA
ncbi:hypothetical protein [Halomonas sp. WWR20]